MYERSNTIGEEIMTKCDSSCYFRDRGYENCDLTKGHRGIHKHKFVETWEDD